MKKYGFTLIELLVVIAIIALLLAILVPSLNRAKIMAMEVLCGANLHNYALGTTMYLQENNDEYPIPWFAFQNRQAYSDAGVQSGEHPMYCRWHDRDYNNERNPEFAGDLWPYLAEQGVHICPVFEMFAQRHADIHTSHPVHNPDIPIEPQYNYSMNGNLGPTSDADGNAVRTRAFPGYKSANISQPSDTFVWSEENTWPIPEVVELRNQYHPERGDYSPLDDTALMAGTNEQSWGNVFGSFHRTPIEKLTEGVARAVMVDGSLKWVSWDRTWYYANPKK